MKRRMIAQDIVSEGRFLRMSLTAQALYMHLVANADDDGCVDAYTITRMIGAKEDDLVLLKEREYITVLDEKEYILWITGWQDFNWIDPRIKEDSKHLPLLRAKVEGLEVVESVKKDYNRRRYAKRKLERQIEECSAHVASPRIHGGDTGKTTEEPRTRIGKDRKGEDSKETIPNGIVPVSPGYAKWEAEFEASLGFRITKEPKKNESALKGLVDRHGAEAVHSALGYLNWLKREKKAKDRPYWFQYVSSFLKVRDFWDQIQAGLSDGTDHDLGRRAEMDELFSR